ncbi:MAG: UbiA family prenyltransferase [Vicingaceae bacterium]
MFDALKLMRIPFSIFLMPVFWFSLSNLESPNVLKGLHLFLMIHLFVYPASNGYNSYFDRDEGSIGGLESPPKVNSYLFPMVVAFDLIAILYAAWIRPELAVWIGLYLLVSKAYSYDKIRLKRRAITSTLVVTFFQGCFMFLATLYGMGLSYEALLSAKHLLPAFCSSLFLLGSYPLTQIYQHQEDAQRGDRTLSLKLGIKGTFQFSRVFFGLGAIVLISHYLLEEEKAHVLIFLLFGLPILFYFENWAKRCRQKAEFANYKNAMRMNQISSLSLSAAFIFMIFY